MQLSQAVSYEKRASNTGLKYRQIAAQAKPEIRVFKPTADAQMKLQIIKRRQKL